MPIYEYACPTCGVFEHMQKFSDPLLTTCPNGHPGVERKISASGFILKGSGWYISDYARKGDNGKAKGEASGSSDSKPAGESKAADSKPAAAGSAS